MKVSTTFCRVLLVAVPMSLLLSCQKFMDYFPKGKPVKHYRIKRIVFQTYNSMYDGNFYYNKWGDPDSVKFGFVATGHPNLYFKYNHKRQLTELREFYEVSLYEQWHRFGYTGDQITTDTNYVFGSQESDPEPHNYYNKKIIYFEYDAGGRIIKETYDNIDPEYPSLIFLHHYGADGNRTDGFIPPVYDSFLNPHTLHPIWQFMAKDYSVNNPIPAVAYNPVLLPVRFDQPFANVSKFPFVGGARSLEKATIEYETK